MELYAEEPFGYLVSRMLKKKLWLLMSSDLTCFAMEALKEITQEISIPTS